MKQFSASGVLVFVLTGIFSLSSFADTDKPLSILFIGNSYTYFNNLPGMLEGLANEAGQPRKVRTEMVVAGGATLEQHWFGGEALPAIRRGGWNYVVLQEQSSLGPAAVNGVAAINDPRFFHTYAMLFDAEIKKAGAKTALMLTWAPEGKENWQMDLNKAYVSIAEQLGAMLIPVGPAWQKVRHELPGVSLYSPDGSHPSAAGTYVATCVFQAVFFGDSIIGKPGTIEGLPIDLSTLQKGTVPQPLVQMSPEGAIGIQKIALAQVNSAAALAESVAAYSPQRVELPTVPQGVTVPLADIAGEWTGELHYYYGPPAKMKLTIARVEDQWKADLNVAVDSGASMSIPFPAGDGDGTLPGGQIFIIDQLGDKFYSGAYTGSSIEGIATSIIGRYPVPSKIGSWVLTKSDS